MPLHITITHKDAYILIGENIKVKVTRKIKGDGSPHSKHISVSIDAPKDIKITRESELQEDANDLSGNI